MPENKSGKNSQKVMSSFLKDFKHLIVPIDEEEEDSSDGVEKKAPIGEKGEAKEEK